MPAYFLVDVREVKNEARMEEYRKGVSSVVEKFGGRYLVVGGPAEVVEGDWKPVFPVLLEFPSMDAARRWYNSEDYKKFKQIRLASTTGTGVFLPGLG